MTRICWWLVDRLSGMLEPDEREAVCGDLAESGESGGRALRNVLGLVVRRQAALWKGWRPWVAMIGLIGPIAILLSLGSSRLDRFYDLQLWIIRNYKDVDPAILSEIGLSVRHGIALLVRDSLLLAFLSWTGGYAVGHLSRRRTRIDGAIFCLLVLISGLLFDPPNRQYNYDVSGWIFSRTFYTVIFPLISRAVLVLFPSLWGMRIRAWPRWRNKTLRGSVMLLMLTGVTSAADQPGIRANLFPEKDRKPAADFALQDATGKTVKIGDYRGKVVLLDFWATWCTGCKLEIPWFSKFQETYREKGFAVVGVSLDQDGWKVLKPYLNVHKVPYQMLLGNDPTAQRYGIQSLPDTFLIDRQGRVAAIYKEGLVDRDNIEGNIKALLSQR
jgi:cytochrome c biogenesis protein CcmG/thiol:disulfide interchange protein DsbE